MLATIQFKMFHRPAPQKKKKMQRCNNFTCQSKDLTNGTDKILGPTRRRPKISEEMLYFALSHYHQDKRKGKNSSVTTT
jgi:hypothetical protein